MLKMLVKTGGQEALCSWSKSGIQMEELAEIKLIPLI
jgi:hypothetical protein